jgi:hypothetical protein
MEFWAGNEIICSRMALLIVKENIRDRKVIMEPIKDQLITSGGKNEMQSLITCMKYAYTQRLCYMLYNMLKAKCIVHIMRKI